VSRGVLGEYGLNEEQGNEIIMAARAHWFTDEEAADADPRNERVSADIADAGPERKCILSGEVARAMR
jgi:N utilization substance protein A